MSGESLSAVQRALLGRRARRDGLHHLSEPLAIVGMGCRVPGGVDSPEAFWDLLRAGTVTTREVPPDRWDIEEWYDPDPSTPGRTSVKSGSFLDHIDRFDPAFFGIPRREAERMDPHQRLALEVAWEALEDAGIPMEAIRGGPLGVFVASYNDDFVLHHYLRPDTINERTITGVVHAVVANRISHFLGAHGPSLTVDTACSSSLVALHLATRALRDGSCDVALAGGVSLMLRAEPFISLSKAGFMSPDGRCKTFDARADGFGRGEGCGFVVLKRLADALEQGERVIAVVRGSAVNQDGRSTILAAPNGRAQMEVVRAALEDGGVEAAAVGYVEAHGTGTRLGDPIEVEALGEALGAPAPGSDRWLASAKANLGHLEAAAGIVGVIRAALAVRHGWLPPHAGFETANPLLELERNGFRIPTEGRAWASSGPRTAGVSSFGVGGTNAHVVLEEAPALPPRDLEDAPAPWPLVISARGGDALVALARLHAEHLDALGEDADGLRLHCAATAARRSRLESRMAVVASSAGAAAAALRATCAGPTARIEGVSRGRIEEGSEPRPVFVFSGQGSQWMGMGTGLAREEPVARAAFEEIDEIFEPLAGWSIRNALEGGDAQRTLDDTALAQPAIFAVQVAVARLLASWGIHPFAVVGHSVGEIAAGHVSGHLDLATAVRMVHERGRLMQEADSRGAMLATRMTRSEAEAVVAETDGAVQLAAVNAPRSVVLSGSGKAIDGLVEQLADRRVQVKRLPVRYGFHSAMMTPIAARVRSALTADASAVPPADPPSVPGTGEPSCLLVSTITGAPLASEGFDAEHLAAGIDGPVLFEPAITHTLDRGATVFVEIGPRPVLTGDLLAIAEADDREVPVLPSMKRDAGGRATLVDTAGALFCAGVEPDWDHLTGTAPAGLPLPRYPWQRDRYWLDAPERGAGSRSPAGEGLAGLRLDSPAIEDPTFETVLHASDPRVADHRIRDEVLVPAAMMLEMARQAGTHVVERPVEVVDATFLRKVVLGDQPHRLHLIVRPGDSEDDRRRIELHACDPTGRWALAFEAGLRTLPDGTGPGEADRREEIDGLDEDVDVERLYAVAAEAGAQFGPRYRRLSRLRHGGGAALGELDREGLPGDGGLSPALLDAALHPTMVLLGADAPIHLPASIGAFAARPGSAPTQTLVRELAGPAGARVFDLRLLDDDGVEVARVDRLVLRPAPSDLAVFRRPEEALYRVGWREVELPPPDGAPLDRVLLVGDDDGFARELADRLREDGATVEILDQGSDLASQGAARSAIVLCSGLARIPGDATPSDVALAASDLARPVLELARAPVDRSTPVLLLSRAAQAPEAGYEGGHPAAASLAGLARALRREHPELATTALDLAADEREEESGVISRLLRHGTDEPVLALRSGLLLAQRLEAPTPEPAGGGADRTRIAEFTVPGDLGSVQLTEVDRRRPVGSEVEVRVLRAALNFRDVLAGLGMVDARTDRALGHECAGVVSRVGPDVTGIRPGDRVLALAEGAFGDYVLATEQRIFTLPATTGWTDAVTLPIAALTARHALVTLGGLEAGQRVLVHSGAGGVGQAAVQLALSLGAEVYATAGSPRKRAFLESMGVRGAFDSRSLSFRDDILAATDGEGVDSVLNSLTDEAIDASLELLIGGGTFIELGKRDLRDAGDVADAWSGVRYRSFDLFDEIDRDADAQHAAWDEVRRAVDAGEISPLSKQVFPRARIEHALRFMSRAEHVGKIVLHVSDRREPVDVRADGAYLVTGGTGGVGMATARWLVSRGAGRVVLASRSEPSGEAAGTLDTLRADGADVRWIGADLEDLEAVRELVTRASEGDLSIRGVVHAAGVLDDGLLADLGPERFRVPFGPKVTGAIHLARCLEPTALDFLLLCSAAGSLLDPAGQGNYAAANHALEALGRELVEAGWPVTSLAWGLWDGGMAGKDAGAVQRRWSEMGLGAIGSDTAPALLDAILGSGQPSLVPALLNRHRLLQEASHLGPLLDGIRGLESRGPETRPGAVMAELRSLPSHRRPAGLRRHIAARLARVLGVPKDSIAIDRPFRDQGMDSLMAVEIRNVLTRDFGVALSSTLAFDHPDIPAMAAHLSPILFGEDGGERAPEGDDAPDGPAPALDIDPGIASLSDEEAERLLLEELEGLVDDEGQGR